MSDFGPLLELILLALGVAGGYYVANRKYQALVSACAAFFINIQQYWQAKADGCVTPAEEQSIGKATVKFFDELALLGVTLRK